ncbi:hypothetical protein V565_027640 [Rhizoctonia solani 123E]|uniref:Uncharacterized protein n=1 Tax=Rhizoctonia solani 123E TaxID=1423351 RepID=A0A074S332_9AGAM|nr:hypothetical protein V565_027640 [Rhizoctonia solani 123E]
MATTLQARYRSIMRSHSSLHSSPYSTSALRATSLSVTQARSHRLAGQNQHWSTSQSQEVVNTFADSSATTNSMYGPPLDDNWTGDGSLAVYDHNNSFTSLAPCDSTSTPASATLDRTYGVAFAQSSIPRDYLPARTPLQNPAKSSSSYTNAGSYRFSPYSTSAAECTTFSSSLSDLPSQAPPFTCGAETSSAQPSYTNNASVPTQYQQLSSTTQPQPRFDTSYPTSFGGPYLPAEDPASTYSAPVETPEVHYSYDDQHSYYPPDNDRRGSIASSLSDYHRSYYTNESQTNSVYGHPTEQNTIAVSPHNSASPATVHTPSPRQAPSQELTMPGVHGVGSTESVSRRVGLMLHTQKCQQAEQTERTPIDHPSSRGRRDKRSPTSDVTETDEGTNSLTKYKAAYERVRLQRNFYERATSSLVHQVNMLGGDPMQASRWASKGEDLDPKQARILVASLQHELETLRNKLIQTQKELHSIRQSCDDSSRSLRRRVNSGNFLREEDDKAPLSAAPVTVYTQSRKR